jgi:O-antigen/teichoic acid export membrane protein
VNTTVSRIFRNVGLLMGSTGIVGVCAVVTLGFNTRSLGVHDFGVLSLIQAYVALVSSLSSFESWQPVVRLGVRLPGRLQTTLASGLILDFSAACVAAISAIACVLTFGQLFGIDAQYQGLAAIYSLSLFAGVAGTPKGFFRLRHDFKVLAGNQSALAIAMMLASIALWAADARLPTYVLVFAIIAATYNLTLAFRMLAALRREGRSLSFAFSRKSERRHLGIMFRMATGNSVLSSLLMSRRHIALFVVGHILGETAAGVYSVAAKLVTSVSKFALLLNQVLFSEVMGGARQVAPDRWRRMVWRISWTGLLLAACVAAVGAALSGPLVGIVGGAEFNGAASVFGLLFLAECVGLAGIHFNPIIQHEAGTWPLVRYSAVGLAVFLAAGVFLCLKVGTLGAAMGVVVSSVLVYALMAGKVWRMLNLSSLRARGTRNG